MILNPQSKFTLDEIEDLMRTAPELSLHKGAREAMDASAKFVASVAQGKDPIYGINTGFGRLASKKIPTDKLVALQLNLLRSHACGIGAAAAPQIVRRLLLTRAISLGKGRSGIRSEWIERHLDYWNEGAIPKIPLQGSVGASGDLAPLAHLALTFIGEGKFIDEAGRDIAAAPLLKKHGWKALTLAPKEGLALVNGTQFGLALALEARAELHHLLPWMEAAYCLSVEAHRATAQTLREDLHALKDHPTQQSIAKRIFSNLKNSPHMKGHKDCELVQDSYSFRCAAQVMSPCYEIFGTADRMLEGEVNSISDNPIVFVENGEILSGGHFHAQSVSMASDLMTMGMVTLGNLIERRIDQMVNPLTSRGAAFLAKDPGVESGLMIVQTAAAALASENKTLAFPASADTISTNGNQEDHVSMAPWAARKSLQVATNLRRLIAAELLTAVRGALIEKEKTKLKLSPWLEEFMKGLKKDLPCCFEFGDHVFADDWAQVERHIQFHSVK